MSRRIVIGLFLLSLMSPVVQAYNNANLPDVIIGEPGKNVGDIVAPSTRLEIAAWCDFNKQIVVVSPGVYLCSFNGKNASSP